MVSRERLSLVFAHVSFEEKTIYLSKKVQKPVDFRATVALGAVSWLKL